MKLIKELCEIHSPSGDEYQMKDFILKYINKEKNKWLKVPKIIQGDEMQDCLMLVFGKPRTAIFAHSGKKRTMVDIARDGDRP